MSPQSPFWFGINIELVEISSIIDQHRQHMGK